MKIICIHDNYPVHGGNKEDDSTFSIQRPVVSVKPDSSLLKDGKPFFLPSFSADIRCGASVVLRVCRLGKCVARRFAHRYYDAVTVGVSFHAADLLQEARMSGGRYSALYDGFDGAAVLGDFVGLDEQDGRTGLPFTLDINGEEAQRGDTGGLLHGLDRLIEEVSEFYTLKMGDLIYTGFPSEDLRVAIGDNVRGFIGNRQVLQFNIR
ncbi:MAG TPA: fumarylacetoacetate hydrolase family protein [Candidatus Avibacteroides faecavium]|nr:fumarylacetoacetate hydrolase family protein [Candidatus Avibacteroides faecavium]